MRRPDILIYSKLQGSHQRSINLHLLLDTPQQVRALKKYDVLHNITFSVFIEMDCDGHRGGLPADRALLGALPDELCFSLVEMQQ